LTSITDTPNQVLPDARPGVAVPERALPTRRSPNPQEVTAAPGWVVRVGRAAGAVGKRVIAIGLLVAVWEVLPRLGVVDATFLPPLSEVLTAWWGC